MHVQNVKNKSRMYVQNVENKSKMYIKNKSKVWTYWEIRMILYKMKTTWINVKICK